MYEAIEEKAIKNSQVRIEEMSESEPFEEVAKRTVVVKTWFISRNQG
jgi:hypothetical protein